MVKLNARASPNLMVQNAAQKCSHSIKWSTNHCTVNVSSIRNVESVSRSPGDSAAPNSQCMLKHTICYKMLWTSGKYLQSPYAFTVVFVVMKLERNGDKGQLWCAPLGVVNSELFSVGFDTATGVVLERLEELDIFAEHLIEGIATRINWIESSLQLKKH